MIIYQIILAFIMLNAINICNGFDGKVLGFCLWGILGIIPLIVKWKNEKITKEEIERNKRYFEYQEKYYNDYGEMP